MQRAFLILILFQLELIHAVLPIDRTRAYIIIFTYTIERSCIHFHAQTDVYKYSHAGTHPYTRKKLGVKKRTFMLFEYYCYLQLIERELKQSSLR